MFVVRDGKMITIIQYPGVHHFGSTRYCCFNKMKYMALLKFLATKFFILNYYFIISRLRGVKWDYPVGGGGM